MQYCAVCLIAKDENKYIREWADYHLRIGFDTLIIYDNCSRTPLAEELDDFIACGRIIVHSIEDADAGWVHTQSNAYTDCMSRYQDMYKWIAVIDSDEFIFPKNTNHIKEFLAEYEGYGGVVMPWVIFGTGGLRQNLSKSQVFSFIHADTLHNSIVKSIVQPRKVACFTGPHGAFFHPGFYAVTPDHLPLEPNVYSAPSAPDVIQVNHYFMRSRDEYENKAALKARLNRPMELLPDELEQERYSRKDMGLATLYTILRDGISQEGPVPPLPDSVRELVVQCMELLEEKHFLRLELLLCDASLVFESEPMIWMLRSLSARLRGNITRAFHCIQEALKLSGSSTIYYELARIFKAMGDEKRSLNAELQASYKQSIEETLCETS